MKIINNYHTHTVYCNHAKNTMEEMILKAIEMQYETIGFSEHAPLKKTRKFRLNWSNIQNYLNEGKALKEKYKNQIKVFIGFECEYCIEEYEYYKKIRDLPGCDYLIFGNHNYRNPQDAIAYYYEHNDIEMYTKQFIDGCNSGLFSMIAHPEFILRYRTTWDELSTMCFEKMIKAAIENDLPLGFNLNGLKSKRTDFDYPSVFFWKMVGKTNAKVIIETDAHETDLLNQCWVEKAEKLIKLFNVEKNLIWDIKLK